MNKVNIHAGLEATSSRFYANIAQTHRTSLALPPSAAFVRKKQHESRFVYDRTEITRTHGGVYHPPCKKNNTFFHDVIKFKFYLRLSRLENVSPSQQTS